MSSKRRQRRNSCEGKAKHYDRERAVDEQRRLQAKTGHVFDVYRCGFCGLFHVGHKRTPGWQAARRKRRGDYKWTRFYDKF